MGEPIIPPDLTDLVAMRLYYEQLHAWIKDNVSEG